MLWLIILGPRVSDMPWLPRRVKFSGRTSDLMPHLVSHQKLQVPSSRKALEVR